jgi:hypothetical protein
MVAFLSHKYLVAARISSLNIATNYHKIDEFLHSHLQSGSVIPAKAGIQYFYVFLDSGFRRSDELTDFLCDH